MTEPLNPARGQPATPPPRLYWLARDREWLAAAKSAAAIEDAAAAWAELQRLANNDIDFIETNRIDTLLRRRFGDAPPPGLATKPVRLAVLGSSTVTHLLPGVRVAGLRRGMWIKTYEGDYGQYSNEISDSGSGLHAFEPDAILFALDSVHMTRGLDASASEAAAEQTIQSAVDGLRALWKAARAAFRGPILQQTLLPVFPSIIGNNEQRLPGSPARAVAEINRRMRAVAGADGVDLLALDDWAGRFGLDAWRDPVLWHRAKQEVTPTAAPFYGDLVARLLAARQGRSAKCLVLDLDNTLWGGVIGDDGLDGIVLGQGNAAGEAFLTVQAYALEQARRGVILAVCSKNDEVNAWAPFDKHPDMLLKRKDIACFVANWNDKASNLRLIAQRLNIGIDSLVFLDDNPFERNLVRSEAPMVAVPEISEEPSYWAQTIADAGYFEGVSLTAEDRERSEQYRANAERDSLMAETSDIDSYLRSLDMRLISRRFDTLGLSRVTQLINKTNQFNLTTRRYSEDEVRAVIDAPDAFGLYMRLIDRFGDNGIIAIVIARLQANRDALIDTWLMSCRVLKRQVEAATLNLLAAEARKVGAERLIGAYRPTAKNGMVKDLYRDLGFTELSRSSDGSSEWLLDLSRFAPAAIIMAVEEQVDRG
jgi:FkbH-like protein